MYTATLIGDTKNIELRRRMVNVEFSEPYQVDVFNEETQLTESVTNHRTFAKEFQFKIDETVTVMKSTVKQYLDELNFVPPTITDLTPDAEVVPPKPTAAELARTEWDSDRAKLKTMMELVRDGVFTGSETQITALQAKVKTGFKVGYLG